MAFGSIKGITIEFRGDTTKLDKALRTVKSEAKSTQNELRSIDRALKFNPRSVELWKQKQTVLNNAIRDTRAKLDIMKRSLNEMSKKGLNAENSEEFRKLAREIDQAERELKGFERELRAVGNANLRALGQQFKDIGSKMTNVGRSMSMYVTGPLVGLGAVAAKGFAEVDKTMQLTNSTMGNTKEQADLLNKAMKEAAANSTFGMTDAATATLNFARAGLTAEQAASALAPAMNLAAGEGGELDTVSAGLVATINGFHDSFDNAATYADVFANACNNSALDVNSLSQAMSVAAPIFAAAGYSVEDAALYMGVMANNGIQADKAANSLKTGMARLISPSKDAATWMDKLSFSITNNDGTMKDTITVQKELHDAFADLGEAEQIAAASAIFGKNQMSPWLALINTAPGDVDKLSKAIMEEGTATKMAGDMMQGFGGSMEKLKSSLDVAKVSLGEALAPIILKVANAIQGLVDWFNELSPAMQSTVAVIGMIVAAIGPVLVILGTIASSIGSLMTFAAAIAEAGGAAAIFGKAMAVISKALAVIASPIGLVVAAIGVLVAAFMHLWKTNEEFRSKMLEIWNGIKETISSFVEQARAKFEELKGLFTGTAGSLKAAWDTFCNMLAPMFEIAFSAIATVVQTVLNAILGILDVFIAVFQGDWSAAWEAIKGVFSTILTGIISVFELALQMIQTIFRTVLTIIVTLVKARLNAIKNTVVTVFNAIKTFVSSVWNGIKALITNAIDGARTKVQSIVNSIRNAVTTAFNAIKSTAKSTWNSIKDAMINPIQTAKDKIKSIIDKIKGFFPLKVGKIFSGLKLPHFTLNMGTKNFGKLGSISYPTGIGVSWYAKGGIFDGPSIIGVGEAGPEAVIPIEKLQTMLDASNAKQDYLLEQIVRLNALMYEQMQKEKDFRIDGRVAGRIVNDLVKV